MQHSQQLRECIILAGGLGTRLRSAVPDLPKCMAEVAGEPFITHVINYLQTQGISKFIFSLGYMHEVVEEFVRKTFNRLDVSFSIEEDLLGTGGAIQLACNNTDDEDVLIINGDTLFKADINALFASHISHGSRCTLALKSMEHIERYGLVEIDEKGYVTSFKEKNYYAKGFINGGVYVLHVPSFLKASLPEKFSFEKDYLEKYFAMHKMNGVIQDTYFIDIGIPEDFERANHELSNK